MRATIDQKRNHLHGNIFILSMLNERKLELTKKTELAYISHAANIVLFFVVEKKNIKNSENICPVKCYI